jgi:hypothetical protein
MVNIEFDWEKKKNLILAAVEEENRNKKKEAKTLIKHGGSRHGCVVAPIAVLPNTTAILLRKLFLLSFFPELCMIINYCIVIHQFSFCDTYISK